MTKDLARVERLPERVKADRVIAKLRVAEQALAQATSLQDVKLIADLAHAQEVFAHRQNLGTVIEAYAHEIKWKALAKLGDVLKDLPKNAGARGVGKSGVPQQNPTYTDLGLDKKTAMVAQQLAALPSATRDAIAAGETTLRDERKPLQRQARVDKIVEISKANEVLGTAQRFPVIYADPPWRYEHVKTESRAIENQYPTMLLDEICALPVKDLATDDAVLLMWATAPKLHEALLVLHAWDFVYRTCAVWVKDKIGMGYYFRQRHELLLVGTRGDLPVPAESDRLDSVFELPRGEHSAKPREFYEAIERMYPAFAKIELFAREARDGWSVWGNQAVAS